MPISTLRQHIQRLELENPSFYIADASGGIWGIQGAIQAFEAHEFHRDNLDKEFTSAPVDDQDLPPDYVECLYPAGWPLGHFYTVRTENKSL